MEYYKQIEELLEQDFAYKKELELYLPIVQYYYNHNLVDRDYRLDRSYSYDSDAAGVFFVMYLFSFLLPATQRIQLQNLDLQFLEISANNMEQERSAGLGVLLHIYLYFINVIYNDNLDSERHLRAAFDLTVKGNCPMFLIDLVQYMGGISRKQLKAYNQRLYDRVIYLYSCHMKGSLAIAKKLKVNSAYDLFTEDELFMLIVVASGHSNQEIGAIFGVKDRTISRRLSELYARCGINNRNEVKAYVLELLK